MSLTDQGSPTLAVDELDALDAWWRAANYLSVGQIYLLSNPLRRRVQHAVDRRFNRARYDAETLVAAFTARLRQTVDLDTVQGDLVGVIDAAFQPAHVSVTASSDGHATRLRSLVIASDARAEVDIGRVDPGAVVVLDVNADVPVVAEREQFGTGGTGLSNGTGIAG